MTFREYKDKLSWLEANGIIDDNTLVCHYNDDKELCIVNDDFHIVKDVNDVVAELESQAKFYEIGLPNIAEEKRNEIKRLKMLGSKVVFLG